MTPESAVHRWLASFGIPAYAATSVPDEGDPDWQGFPYLTYDLTEGQWEGGEVNMPVNVWYRTDSEAVPNAKVREIADALGIGGITVPCDDGMLWIKKGSPWAQAVRVEGEDEKVKRRYVNINIDYIIP